MQLLQYIIPMVLFLLVVYLIYMFIKMRRLQTELDETKPETKEANKGDILELNRLKAELKQKDDLIQDMKSKMEELESVNEQLRQEQDQLNQQLRKNDHLQKRKEKLFAEFIHDVKNPAGLIKNIAELLDSYDLNMQEQKDMIFQLFSTSDKIIKFSAEISEMLASDKIQTELKLQVVPIRQVVGNVYKNNLYKAVKKNQKVTLDLAKELPECEINPDKIYEAIENLFDNAIKYTPHDGKIEIRVYEARKNIFVEIIDNGPGLEASELDRAFKKGAKLSARPTGGEPSTGLGLWLVKSIAKEHGGSAFVKSEFGKGSTFGIKFPMRQPRHSFLELEDDD